MTDETPRLLETSAPSFNGEPCNLVMNQYDESAAYEAIPLPSKWNPTTLDKATIPITIPILEATIIEPGLNETNIYHTHVSSHLLHFIHLLYIDEHHRHRT